jgi:hypothetical protein
VTIDPAEHHFGFLRTKPVENDWRVTQVMAAPATLDAAPFCLFFASGTCLARAYRLVQRTSELVVPANGGQQHAQPYRSVVKSLMRKRQLDVPKFRAPSSLMSGQPGAFILYKLYYQYYEGVGGASTNRCDGSEPNRAGASRDKISSRQRFAAPKCPQNRSASPNAGDALEQRGHAVKFIPSKTLLRCPSGPATCVRSRQE